MKIAILSDTHLGNRQYALTEREKDFFDAFRFCMQKALEKECSLVLHCGDLFDTQRPYNKVVREAYWIVEETGLPFIVIPGNHDFAWKADVPPGVLLTMDAHNTNASSVTLCLDSPVENIEYGNVNIVGVRYLTPSEMKAWDTYKHLAEKLTKPECVNVLLMHQEWIEVAPFPDIASVASDDLPEGFDYIFIGHIHIPPMVKRVGKTTVVNVGSTENCSYQEAKREKVMWILDTETGNLEQIAIPIRPVVFVKSEADLKHLGGTHHKLPIVVLENKDLEPDVLRYPALKIIRRWMPEDTTQEVQKVSVEKKGLIQDIVNAVVQDRSIKELVEELIDIALYRYDMEAKEIADYVENKIEGLTEKP